MEIRLLVNGNLVHTVTMADLELITSKRDIYFATTAPEFIPKDFRIKHIDNEHDTDNSSSSNCKATKGTNEYSNERILEIKHKLEAQHTPGTDLSSAQNQIETNIDITSLHINSEDNLNKFLPIPLTNSDHSMQRARSLQKPKSCLLDEQKRQISKSNSCGDSYASNSGDKEFSTTGKHVEPPVPPNSPKTSSSDSPVSPTKKYYKLPPSTRNQFNNHNDSNSPEKVKPLRIFRIPLSNLTGAHSHYHTHNSIPKVSKIQTNKIDEDNLEADDTPITTTTTTTIPVVVETNNKLTCDKIGLLNDKFNNITCKCSSEPLFSSL